MEAAVAGQLLPKVAGRTQMASMQRLMLHVQQLVCRIKAIEALHGQSETQQLQLLRRRQTIELLKFPRRVF